MRLTVDKAYYDMGIKTIVFSVIKDIDMGALNPRTESFIIDQGNKALAYSDEILNNDVILGYREMVKSVGRSIKKFPPTAEALISNINRRKSLMRVNGVVDIYNAHTISDFLAVGAHDMRKTEGDICFTFAKGDELFYPIGGGEKKALEGDYIYKDDNGIMAYLDTRDSELYKIDNDTRDIILIIQGNIYTDTTYRIDALNAICNDIVSNFNGEYQIFLVDAGGSILLDY